MPELISFPPNPLIGTWKLISATAIRSEGSTDKEVYGANPTGYLIYTLEGRMMVMFAKRNRPSFSEVVQSPFSDEMNAVPLDVLSQAFKTFNAYAGTYRVKGDTVIHHLEIASIPNRVGTDLVRTFSVRKNQLTLKTPSIFSNSIEQFFELLWERI
jgi:hypothetical protein